MRAQLSAARAQRAQAETASSPAEGWRGRSGFRAVAFLEHEVLGTLGESLGDDLSVERVGKDFGPVFEGPIGRDPICQRGLRQLPLEISVAKGGEWS